ncbi:MAG: putative sulfate exporter family transporter, partial [Acidobacteriaceae bacterium]|nr:putative sulfate exporter family transporter [Acidobacteriaceae bacterium]
MARNLFFIGIILAASGLISPALALAIGLVFGLFVTHPYHSESRHLSRFLLEVAVVLLGFGMNLREVVHAGRSGFLYTSISILFAMAVGLLLGRALAVGRRQSLLISVGTAICGGSAIAAMGPVIEADDDDMAVSLGTIFLLNAVALLIFPPIGWSLHLSET